MKCELALILGYILLVVTDEAEVSMTTPGIHRNVAGYIRVRFTPEILRVSKGGTATGHVHVTVRSHHFIDNSARGGPSQPALHACVVDKSIATASWSWSTADSHRRTDLGTCSSLSSVYERQSTDQPEVAVSYTVTVRGVLIGRSALRFYVIKTILNTGTRSSDVMYNKTRHVAYNDDLSINDDLAVIHEDQLTSRNHVTVHVEPTDQAAVVDDVYDAAHDIYRLSVNVTDSDDVVKTAAGASYVISVTRRWWVTDEYEIVVVSPVPRTTADLLHYLLLTITIVNLVGVGGQFNCDEATQLVRRPSALTVGLFCRFAVMPAVSYHVNNHTTHAYILIAQKTVMVVW